MYRSLERSPRDTRDEFDLHSAQASFASSPVDLARPLRRVDYILRVCQGISLSSCESFIGSYIWCYHISTILACLFTVGVLISWKKLCWKGNMAAEMPSRASYLVYYFVWRVNLSKLSQKFIWALRTTTTNCRVTFIYLYLAFPTNFRIVFLPHKNIVILLEPYCVTITELGLPVV